METTTLTAPFPSQRAAAAGPPGWRPALRGLALDVAVGLLATAAAAAMRIGIEQVVGGVAPFVLTFPAVMAATLVRGVGAGTIALLGCQLLTIRYVFPHWLAPHGGLSTDLANVVLSTVALVGTVWATASYRQAAHLLRSRCERQVDTLSLLIAEMNHRTKNSFQIAAGLLAHQAVSTIDLQLARELERAASRLETLAAVHDDLSFQPEAGDQVALDVHLARLATQLRDGSAPAHVLIACHAEPATVPVQTAIVVGLIVNEWVTNALKHAFGDGPGRIDIDAQRRGDRIEVTVRDDGNGRPHADDAGSGSGLVRLLAEVIGATIATPRRGGTCYTLRFAA